MPSKTIVVTGAGGFIGGHLVPRPARSRARTSARSTSSRSTSGTSSSRRPTTGSSTCAIATRATTALRRRRRRLQPRRRHGRHGLHREQQGRLHALGADQHAPAPGRARAPASSASSTPPRPASTRPTSSTSPDVTALKEADAYPADARGRLRLGEALQRAHVPPLPRGLRPRHARRPLPQRLRPARHLRRRPREGAGGDLPQGRRGQADAAATRSRSGATASRPAASCTSTTASTARRRSWTATIDEPINLGSSELVTINQLVDIVEEIAGIKLERRYDLAAPQGVRGRNSDNTLILKELGWEPSIRLEDGLERTYAWIYDQLAVPVAAGGSSRCESSSGATTTRPSRPGSRRSARSGRRRMRGPRPRRRGGGRVPALPGAGLGPPAAALPRGDRRHPRHAPAAVGGPRERGAAHPPGAELHGRRRRRRSRRCAARRAWSPSSPSFPALLPAVDQRRAAAHPVGALAPRHPARRRRRRPGSSTTGPVLRASRALERLAYREADRIVVLSQAFTRNLEAKGVPSDKIELIYDPATRAPSADGLANGHGQRPRQRSTRSDPQHGQHRLLAGPRRGRALLRGRARAEPRRPSS